MQKSESVNTTIPPSIPIPIPTPIQASSARTPMTEELAGRLKAYAERQARCINGVKDWPAFLSNPTKGLNDGVDASSVQECSYLFHLDPAYSASYPYAFSIPPSSLPSPTRSSPIAHSSPPSPLSLKPSSPAARTLCSVLLVLKTFLHTPPPGLGNQLLSLVSAPHLPHFCSPSLLLILPSRSGQPAALPRLPTTAVLLPPIHPPHPSLSRSGQPAALPRLGNQLLSLVSSFTYALLTNRTLIINPHAQAALFLCDPFAFTPTPSTWTPMDSPTFA
ncbi:unnamed protein product [Closterium sp. Naga37s-1]|nr:unnamed protein product [Closterium sp. Naga37s-1]